MSVKLSTKSPKGTKTLLLTSAVFAVFAAPSYAERENPLQVQMPSLPKNTAQVDVVDNDLAVQLLDVQVDKEESEQAAAKAPVAKKPSSSQARIRATAPVSGNVSIGKRKPIAQRLPRLPGRDHHLKRKPIRQVQPTVVMTQSVPEPVAPSVAEPIKLERATFPVARKPVQQKPLSIAKQETPEALALKAPAAGGQPFTNPSALKTSVVPATTGNVVAYRPAQVNKSFLNNFPMVRATWMENLASASGLKTMPKASPQMSSSPIPRTPEPVVLAKVSKADMVVPSVQKGIEEPKKIVTATPPKTETSLPRLGEKAPMQMAKATKKVDPFNAEMPGFTNWKMNPPKEEKAPMTMASASKQTTPQTTTEVASAPTTKSKEVTLMKEATTVASAEMSNVQELAEMSPAAGFTGMDSASSPSLSRDTKHVISHIPSRIDSPKRSRTEKISIDRDNRNVVAFSEMGSKLDAAYESLGMKIEIRRPVLDINQELKYAYDAVLGGNNDLALGSYERVIKAEPSNLNALYGYATLLHKMGDTDTARKYYHRVLTKDPDHREALNNFLSLMAEESPMEALSQLLKLQKRNPHFSPIPAQISYVYQKMGDYPRAISAMQDAYALAPSNLTYALNLAVLLDRHGAQPQAAEYYQQLVDAQLKGAEIPGNIRTIQERLTFIRSNR